MPLSDAKVKNAKPKEKNYKLTARGDFYLLISLTGGKSFEALSILTAVKKGCSGWGHILSLDYLKRDRTVKITC